MQITGIEVLHFRRCWISADRVELTHPLIFGRGYLFDRTRQVVKIRRCLLGLTVSADEIPFSDVTVGLSSKHVKDSYVAFSEVPIWTTGGTDYFIEMRIRHRVPLKVLCEFGDNRLLKRILAAIEKLGITTFGYHPAEGSDN